MGTPFGRAVDGRPARGHPDAGRRSPFIIAGAVKDAYDLVLWRRFRTIQLPESKEEPA